MAVGELNHTSGFHIIQQRDGLFCGHAHLLLQHGLRNAAVLPGNLGSLGQFIGCGFLRIVQFLGINFFQRFGLPGEIRRIRLIFPGRILLPVCEANGERTLTVTKKDPLWKRARKIRWGERV